MRILNAATITELVRPFMSYGKDERHFDKHIWQLPVPLYDPTDDSTPASPREGPSWRRPLGNSSSSPGGTSRPSGETSAASSPRARPAGTWRRWSRSC